MRFELVPLLEVKPNDGRTYLYYDFGYSSSTLYFGEITEITGPEEFIDRNWTFFKYEFKFKQPRIKEIDLPNRGFSAQYDGFEENCLTIIFNKQTMQEVSLKGYYITRILEGYND